MGRAIVTKKDAELLQGRHLADRSFTAGEAQAVKADEYSERLMKYIPAEVVTVYLFIEGIIHTSQADAHTAGLLWFIFAFLVAMTPVYLWRIQNVKKLTQLLLSTLSFVIWVFTIGGPFAHLLWYKPLYGQLILPLFTFTIAIIQPQK